MAAENTLEGRRTNAPRVIVVGAGMGGLASAMVLAHRGCEVTVIESARNGGGKNAQVLVGGALVDAGPTVLTMRHALRGVFADAGASFDELVPHQAVSCLARHFWSDGTCFDLFADPDQATEEVRRVFGPTEAHAYESFRENAKVIYETVERPFIREQAPTLARLAFEVARGGLGMIGRIDATRTMFAALADRFRDPRLVQLFGRYATYCGSSPYEAPATFNLVSHVESMGVYRVKGGMHALVQTMTAVAITNGTQFRYGVGVERVTTARGRVVGVTLRNGEHVPADAVIFNGDVSAMRSLVPGSRAPSQTRRDARSLSAVTWAMVAKTSGVPLVHHNVFFSDDYEREFNEMLKHGRVPDAPTVYVCAQDRTDAPSLLDTQLDTERALVVVNAPANGDNPAAWTEMERVRCDLAMMQSLNRCGLVLEPRASKRTTPVEWEARFPQTGGSLYGPIARGSMSTMKRQGARTKIAGLYMAGGSIHPGPGVPMAALSGSLAARALLEDLPSISRSPRTGIVGTTSTA